MKPLRGFDRLAAAGFSEQDIASMRLQFHAHSSGDYIDQEFTSDEDCQSCDSSAPFGLTLAPTVDEHARALEEQWIDSLDTAGTASLSNASTESSRTFVNGVLLGFFFPLLPAFFFFESRPAVFWDDGTEHDIVSPPMFQYVSQPLMVYA